MIVYLDIVMILNFFIDLILLLAVNRLCGHPPGWKRVLTAALVGAVYAGMCMLPGIGFLSHFFWRVVAWGAVSVIAFGCNYGAIRRGCLFVLLSMALGGVVFLIGNGGIGALVMSGIGITLLCTVGFRERVGSVSYVPVELMHKGKRVRLTALEDTGNALRDPLTGRPVLVVNAQIAEKLLGLCENQLKDPVATIGKRNLPGLRLITFDTVGEVGGLMLALRVEEVRIGKWKGSSLVAFAPTNLDLEGTYQGLTGGVV